MRVFVTGATGVVGRRVVPLLTAAGHHVTAIARSPGKWAALERQGATAVTADLFDSGKLRPLMAGHEVVVNLATHMPASNTRMLLPGAWRENDRVRRDGSAALVEAALAAGVSRFIQESFAPIYEDGGDRWLDESSPVRPAPYNRSVLDAEGSVARFAAAGGAGVLLRFALFYGHDSRTLHDMLGVMRKGWAPLPGARSAFVSSLAHDDAATAVVAALGLPGGTYNVTDDEPLPRGEWTDTLADAFDIPRPKPLPGWLVKLAGPTMELLGRSQRMSNRKLREAAGWAPAFPSAAAGWKEVAMRMREGTAAMQEA